MRASFLVSLICAGFWVLAAPFSAVATTVTFPRFEQMTIGDTLPDSCPTDGVSLHIQQPGGQFMLCLPNTGVYAALPGGGSSSGIVGVTSSPTGLQGLRYNTVELQNTCNTLGAVSRIKVTGAVGDCNLPDASLSTMPGEYSIFVTAGGSVKLRPTGTNLLNASTGPSSLISGPAKINIERVDDNNWSIDVTGTTGYGEPITSVCTSFGGSTNAASSTPGAWHTHSLSCLIPAGAITAGTILDVCAFTRLVTGAAPPTLMSRFVANSTVLWQSSVASTLVANIPGHVSKHCIGILGAASPSTSSALYTGSPQDLSDSQWSTITSVIGDPVSANTSIDIAVSFETFWSATGNTSSVQLMGLDVRGSRFAK